MSNDMSVTKLLDDIMPQMREEVAAAIAEAGRNYIQYSPAIGVTLLALAGAVRENEEESLALQVAEWTKRRLTVLEIRRAADQLLPTETGQ